MREYRSILEGVGSASAAVYRWRDQFEPAESGGGLALGNSRETTLRKEVNSLKRALAEKTLEVDFFKGALRKVNARRQRSGQFWRDGIYDQIRDVISQQGSLSIERMCRLAPVSRARFYRSLQEARPVEEEMAVRAEIQQIALARRRRYGSPDHGRTSAVWPVGESQAGGAPHARRQPPGRPAADLRGHDVV